MISNSGHDENGKYSGGKAGDQTGGEWSVIAWYNRPWKCVLRYPDAKVRAKIAELARKAAQNDKIGYDQSERGTYWTQLKAAGYDPSKIAVACEADCSAGVIANVKAVGYILGISALKNLSATYTGNMRSGFKSAGFEVLTDSKYLTSDAYLLEGDILLNDSCHTATNLTNGSKATVAQTVTIDPKTIWDFLMDKIGNAFGVAGLMGNLYAESALKPTNLQNSYESKLGYTDASYTAAVDNGSYTNFVKDSAGYGLAQWTYWSRKQGLLKYVQSKKVSIGNLTAQLEFLYKELSESYSGVLSALKNAKSVRAASDIVLTKYEAPADQGTKVQETRAGYGQKYYDAYAGSGTNSSTSSGSSQTGGTTIKKLQGAEKWERGFSNGKKYKTTTALNLRYGASAEKLSNGKDKFGVIEVLKAGAVVTYYGYYTINKDGTKWLYVAVNGKTGFVSSKYLTA